MIHVFVPGTPIPQGSVDVYRPHLVPQSQRHPRHGLRVGHRAISARRQVRAADLLDRPATRIPTRLNLVAWK